MSKKTFSSRLTAPKVRKTTLKWLFAIFRTVFIVGICFTILYPLLTKLSMSFTAIRRRGSTGSSCRMWKRRKRLENT